MNTLEVGIYLEHDETFLTLKRNRRIEKIGGEGEI